MTNQVDFEFVKRSFSAPENVRHYAIATEKIGLWESERIVLQRHLPGSGAILDVGCGTGRVTFGLYRLGFREVEGVDLSEPMIESARVIAAKLRCYVEFRVANAVSLPYDDDVFAGAVFAFNGLMQIPSRANRIAALTEIKRTLRPNGVFVFTSHDRDRGNEKRQEAWRREERRWRGGKQDPRKTELGDFFFEFEGVQGFIHVPDRKEVISEIAEVGFDLVEELWRPELCDESPEVHGFSSDCRFWVVRKPANA